MKMIDGGENSEDNEKDSKIFVDMLLLYYQVSDIGKENSNKDVRRPYDSSWDTKTVSHFI